MLRRTQFKTKHGYGDDVVLHSAPEREVERAFTVTRHPCLDEGSFDLISLGVFGGEDRYSHEVETALPALHGKPVRLNGVGTKSGYPIWVDQMLLDLNENVPGISIRQLARAVGVSKFKAHQVIMGNGIHESY